MKNLTNKKGFTLVELLVVMAILGILVLLAAPRFNTVTEGAKKRTFQNNHQVMISAVTMYMAETGGAYPMNQTAITKFLDPDGLNNKPAGSTYTLAGGVVTSQLIIGSDTFTLTYNVTTGAKAGTI